MKGYVKDLLDMYLNVLNVQTRHKFGRDQIMGEKAHFVSSCSPIMGCIILKHRSLSVNWKSENDRHRMIADS